ncbi:MAG: hypothetical protein ABJG78_18930 [Cyclobacteriaceae bacterium]
MSKTLSIFLLLISVSGLAQESIIKDFAEDRSNLKLCLYPSTLRMVNIKKDPDFYELVNDVEKLLIYTLDANTSKSGSFTGWTDEYRNIGYEEYIAMSGKVDLIILGKDEEYVGVTGTDGNVAAFYLRGAIPFQKIPKLIQTFEGGDMLTLLTNQLDR